MTARNRDILTKVMVGSLYGLLLFLCLHWKVETRVGSPILPTVGLALAVCILYGWKMLPPLWLGGLVGFLLYNSPNIPLPTALLLNTVNVTIPYLASLVLRRLNFNHHMLKIRDLILLIGTACVAAVISGLTGAGAFYLSGTPSTLDSIIHHILAEISGMVIIAPLFLTWNSINRVPFTTKKLSNLVLALTLFTAMTVVLFNTPFGPQFLKTWLLFPIMVWLALSHNLRGICISMAILALSASISTIQGTGPFSLTSQGDLGQMIYSVQQYLPFTAVTMMILAVVADDGRKKYDLTESAAKYKAIIETAVDGIIVIDKDSKIQSLNRAAEKMFGYQPGEVIGQSVDILIPEEMREMHHAAMVHHEKTGERKVLGGPGVTVQALHKDGHHFAAHLAIAEWFVSDNRFYTGIIRDLTEEQQRDAARDLLTREIDHRAKNVLAVVQSLLLLSTGKTKEEFVNNVRGRIASLARAHSLLSQNKWEGASLYTILNEELSTHQGRILFRGQPVNLNTDAVQPFGMIVHELLTNAVKYGSLSVEDGGVVVEWKVKDKNLLLEWQEFGGPKIKEPTESGFGSRLLQQLVNHQLNGSLIKHWNEDGLLACLTIPSNMFKLGSKVESSVEDAAMKLPALSVNGDRILVVEDNALLAMEMRYNLEDAGYEVIGPVSTLEEGLRVVEERHDIQLAVLDINLAGEMSFPIAQALKTKGIPFVFCTGYEIPDTPLSLQDSHVMQKPINEASLLIKLNELKAAA